MNVKVRMPKFAKRPNAKNGWARELLLSIVATSISIVLTFGTAYMLEQQQRKSSQRHMAMMIIHDIDESIRQMEHVDSILRRFSDLQLQILEGKYEKDIRSASPSLISCDPSVVHFAETTERIFTSNVDTWSTIGKVNFIDNVSNCYICRRNFIARVIDPFRQALKPNGEDEILSLQEMLDIDVDIFIIGSSEMISRMKALNGLNKSMMGIKDEDLGHFLKDRQTIDEAPLDSLVNVLVVEYDEIYEKKDQARQSFDKNKDKLYPTGKSVQNE